MKPTHPLHANSLNNPTAVVSESGRIFLMYQRIPAHLKEHSKETATGFGGKNIYRTFLVTSADDGATWSAPLDVTRGTKHETGATTVASGPGIGIQLTRGAHKGRLVMPFNEGPYGRWNNYAAFSDDDGATWPVKRELWPGGFAYSVPARFADGTVGCLFEADGYKRIVFARFPIEWVQ